jgi:hypothetical protein
MAYSTKLLLAIIFSAQGACAWAITVGELDNFSSTLEGWAQGESGTGSAGVSRATSGGPAGAADAYMRIVSDASGEHGKLIVFNRSAAWTGNYVAAGVAGVSMAVNNLGATDLRLRLAFGTSTSPDAGGSWLSSTTPINLPAGSGWTSVQFPIDPAAMTRVQGTATYNSIMSAVSTLRLLHSTSPSNRGGAITATLGVDNITALGPSAVVGDFDGDRMVNGADLAKWRLDFGAAGSDADGDGDSDGHDFLIWQRQVGSSQAASVPEPAAAMAMICAFTYLRTKKRR